MKATFLGALSFIGIAILVVLVLGPDRTSWREGNQNQETPSSSLENRAVDPGVNIGMRVPDGATPAAGVCDGLAGAVVSVAIMDDVPSPRCAKVSAGQKIRVENRTMERITVFFEGTSNTIASRQYSIVPGDAVLIDAPVESYLSLGVHHINVSGYSSPEIWFGAPNEGSLELPD